MEEIRLNKYLSEMGICSRREADRLIEAGKVLVDGQTAPMGMKITPDQKVVCDGKTVGMVENGRRKKPKPVLLMVNKPRGIVSTTSDKDRAMNIVELVKYPERVYPVGRLDKDSEGLILLTNQGDLVNKIMKASNGHEKEYVVTVDKPVTAKFIEKMSAGVYLDELDVTTRECEVRATGKREFTIILTQGLNRQIRRMCEAVGLEVVRLKRNAEGVVKLGMLKPGTYRELTKAEVNGLRAAAAKGRAQTRSAALQSRAAERRPRGPVGRGPAAGKKRK